MQRDMNYFMNYSVTAPCLANFKWKQQKCLACNFSTEICPLHAVKQETINKTLNEQFMFCCFCEHVSFAKVSCWKIIIS